MLHLCFFFFQAEDGIRDIGVTGVQTCALPISVALVHVQGGICGVLPLRDPSTYHAPDPLAASLLQTWFPGTHTAAQILAKKRSRQKATSRASHPPAIISLTGATTRPRANSGRRGSVASRHPLLTFLFFTPGAVGVGYAGPDE